MRIIDEIERERERKGEGERERRERGRGERERTERQRQRQRERIGLLFRALVLKWRHVFKLIHSYFECSIKIMRYHLYVR